MKSNILLDRKSEPLNKLSTGFTLEKRFESEFEKIGTIGRGGFSSVYKVRNIIDNSLYAIKKIKIRIDNENIELQKEISNVLQEIRYLAKFRSEYIVTYNHSWVEVKLKEKKDDQIKKMPKSKNLNFNKKEDYDDDEEYQYTDNSQLFEEVKNQIIFDDANKSNVSIEFVNNSEDQPENNFCWDEVEIDTIKVNSKTWNLKNLNINNKDNYLILGNREYKLDEIDSISIFIQMELCNETLGDYLERRNKKHFNTKNLTYDHFLTNQDEIKHSFEIFQKILCGVEYIHNKEKIIHRDLKPNNIFFSSGQIKIGDVGLATNSLSKSNLMICPSPILERSLTNDQNEDSYENDLGLESSFKLEIEETNIFKFDTIVNKVIESTEPANAQLEVHTSNIGTTEYAAPEQLSVNYYDSKVDIYSLGLILLEIFYPFSTRMEKHEVLDGLRNKRFVPPLLVKRFSKISELILQMTETDANKRPPVSKCMILIKNIQDMMITGGTKNNNSSVSSNWSNISNSNSPISQFKNDIDLVDSLNFKEKRKRFLSEDISRISPIKFQMRTHDEGWKDIWVKLLNNKMLIYFKENANKAHIIYDITECEVNAKFLQDHSFEYNNQFKLTQSFKIRSNKLEIPENLVNRTRLSSTNLTMKTSSTTDEDHDFIFKPAHLNYLIEINHPYQQKCVIKGNYVFEAMDLFHNLEKINGKTF